MKEIKILIDPGHGGTDPGAVSSTGIKEADINFQYSIQLQNILKSLGHSANLTRFTQPELVTLSNRVKFANSISDLDLIISIHCNAATNFTANGVEIFTSPGQTKSDLIATEIFNSIKSNIPELKYNRVDMSDGDLDKEANFFILTKTKAPAVLLELDFISFPNRAELLLTPSFMQRYCIAIVQGILNYFKG